MISHYWLQGGPLELPKECSGCPILAWPCGFIYLKTLQPGHGVIMFTACWMILNDLMDYGLGLHPDLFAAGQTGLALITAAGLSLTITVVMALRRRFKAGPEGTGSRLSRYGIKIMIRKNLTSTRADQNETITWRISLIRTSRQENARS